MDGGERGLHARAGDACARGPVVAGDIARNLTGARQREAGGGGGWTQRPRIALQGHFARGATSLIRRARRVAGFARARTTWPERVVH